MNPITYIIINLGIVLLIYYGALSVNSGSLSQGQVVALYNYMSQILVELIKFANLIVTISKAFASGSRIATVLDIDSTLLRLTMFLLNITAQVTRALLISAFLQIKAM